MPTSKRRSRGSTPDHITKARLVEEIVALLHETDGVTVERNVSLPSLSDSSNTREVDVLITGEVSGYPIRIPVECKNYGKRITAGQIDENSGKLQDVGLSVRNSLYVSVNGFGRDAKRRAKDHGIKVFELKGLTPDRLSSVVHQAFQSAVHLLLRVEHIEFQSGQEQGDLWPLMFMRDKRGNICGGLFDIIWKKWMSEAIPATWGLQELVVTPPAGWHWHLNGRDQPQQVTVGIRVIGLILTAAGEANMHVLTNILDQKLDRTHIRAIFRDTPDAIRLKVVDNEEQFQAAIRTKGLAQIVFRSERAPRIQVLDKLYWPPTEKSVGVVTERVESMLAVGPPDWNALQALTFDDLEGTDIGAIWGKTWSGHPSSRGADWTSAFS